MNERLEDVRSVVGAGLTTWQVPGVALSIVRSDRVLLSEGFGLRDVERGLEVTERTLFPIASATKPFTTAAIGTLVAEGRVDWDDRVVDLLPWFRLADDHATARSTLRDLLTHQTGLPGHNFAWYAAEESRRQLIERARYLEPAGELRSGFRYQNLMFVAAGYLAGEIDGEGWESLVRRRILEPLGMSDSWIEGEPVLDTERARLYGRPEGEIAAIEPLDVSAMGPAGGIHSTARDLSRWMQFHLNAGEHSGDAILPFEVLREIHSPQVVVSATGDGPEIPYLHYALGWNVFHYRGHRVLHHAGGTRGMASAVALLPDDDFGIALVANRTQTGLVPTLLFSAIDRLLGLPPIDWTERNHRDLVRQTGDRRGAGPERGAMPVDLDLETYAGTYEDAGYGVLQIEASSAPERSLRLVFRARTVPLRHDNRDTFQTTGPGEFGGLTLQFARTASGDIDGLLAGLEPALPPIRFERRPFQPTDRQLRSYVGSYSIDNGPTLAIELRGERLELTLGGQPPYALVPLAERRFRFDGLDGFGVDFELPSTPDDRSPGLVLREPDGETRATRLAQ